MSELLLGKNIEYKKYDKVDNNLLYAIDRKIERDNNNITIKFTGYDVWHCYEFSCLVQGKRVRYILKIIYSQHSNNIVESKSLKLYLNSFNFVDFENINNVKNLIIDDFKNKLNIDIIKLFFLDIDCDLSLIEVEDFVDGVFFNYNLRSNCRITGQPDWGTIVIIFEEKEKNIIDEIRKNLDIILIELEQENHFHEECCELILQKLTSIYKDTAFLVNCFYVRRGGIDINVIRSNAKSIEDLQALENEFIEQYINDENTLIKTIFQ